MAGRKLSPEEAKRFEAGLKKRGVKFESSADVKRVQKKMGIPNQVGKAIPNQVGVHIPNQVPVEGMGGYSGSGDAVRKRYIEKITK